MLQIGDTWTAEDCSEYVCNAIGEVEQTAPTCGQQAECIEVDGELGCYCQPGFEGDPYDECTPITCTDEDGQEHQVGKIASSIMLLETTIIFENHTLMSAYNASLYKFH